MGVGVDVAGRFLSEAVKYRMGILKELRVQLRQFEAVRQCGRLGAGAQL
jgi:hypothetical protein